MTSKSSQHRTHKGAASQGDQRSENTVPAGRRWLRPLPPQPEVQCADANGYPIRLSSPEAIEAMDLPPPPPPNTKILKRCGT